jgi:phasin family protein
MSHPTDAYAAWQKVALDATFACLQSTLAGAEQLFKLNIDTAHSVLEQQTQAVRDLLSINDPQQLVAARARLAQVSMQQSAAYAYTICEILSQVQRDMAKAAEEQFARLNENLNQGADALSRSVPGSEVSLAVVKSSMAASAAIIEDLNRATKQFQDLSEARIKAATANMVSSAGKK